MVTVIEVDQWTATGDLLTQTWDAIVANPAEALRQVQGGDAAAERAIFGGTLCVKDVEARDQPRRGSVWLVKGEDGHPVFWKARYDSSD